MPTVMPTPTEQMEDLCAGVGEDDDSSWKRVYKNFDCVQLARLCWRSVDIQNRCPMSCCMNGEEIQLAEEFLGDLPPQDTNYFGYAAVFVLGGAFTAAVISMRRRKYSDSYVALLENEI